MFVKPYFLLYYFTQRKSTSLIFPLFFSCLCIPPLRETSGISITQEGNEVSPIKHKKSLH